ncbi:MAG: CHAT domain-containing protein [Waterburya sp.]
MKILILEANPHQDLSLDKEIRELRRVIDDASDHNKFQIRDSAAISKDRLHESVLKLENEEPKDDPIIVHFCGHGSGEKGLVFANKNGESDLVDTKVLADFFALFENRVVCVVMNACYTEVQANEIVKHIKYVIGMNQVIQDDAAIAFSIGFYRALGYGRSFEDAFKFGTNAIQLAINDGSKSRDAIKQEMRKLLPIAL